LIPKPHTWHRPAPKLTTTVTVVALLLTGVWVVLLVATHEYDSTPPFLLAAGTAVALAWVWRMQLYRTAEEKRADEELIGVLRRSHLDNADRVREEAAFREIARHFDEEGGN
jgi:hypothetical protein